MEATIDKTEIKTIFNRLLKNDYNSKELHDNDVLDLFNIVKDGLELKLEIAHGE